MMLSGGARDVDELDAMTIVSKQQECAANMD
jgi:hypothetical protein